MKYLKALLRFALVAAYTVLLIELTFIALAALFLFFTYQG